MPTHTAILHQLGTEQDEDTIATGATAAEATANAKRALLISWDENPDSPVAMALLASTIQEGEVLCFVHEDQERTHSDTLTERLALLAWHVAALDEDAAPMLFASIRKDDHEAIAQLILSDHTLTNDAEAKAAIDAVYAGEDAT